MKSDSLTILFNNFNINMKEYFSQGLLATFIIAMVFSFSAFVNIQTADAQTTMNMCQTVEALISAGVIAPSKADSARRAAGCPLPVNPNCPNKIVELLINLGFISPSNANAARAAFGCPAIQIVPPSSVDLIPSDTFVSYNLVQGSVNPAPYNLHLTNASSATINFKISVPNQPSWLNTGYNTQLMSLNSGGVMGVGVSVDVTKVSGPGTYTTELIFAGDFSNSPITIPITLNVLSTFSQPSVTATILTSSEITAVKPYIIGTASGVNNVGIVLTGEYGDKVYGSGLIPVVNGKWSVTVSPALTLGEYVIYVYDESSNKLTSKSLKIIAPIVEPTSISLKSTPVGTNQYDYLISSDSQFEKVVLRADCNSSEIQINSKGGMDCNIDNIIMFNPTNQYSYPSVVFVSQDGNTHAVRMNATAYMNGVMVGLDKRAMNIKPLVTAVIPPVIISASDMGDKTPGVAIIQVTGTNLDRRTGLYCREIEGRITPSPADLGGTASSIELLINRTDIPQYCGITLKYNDNGVIKEVGPKRVAIAALPVSSIPISNQYGSALVSFDSLLKLVQSLR